jgi:hypothetical protein
MSDIIKMRGNPNDVQGLLDLCKEFPNNAIMAEVGSYAGESTKIFLESKKIKKLYAIDPWKGGYNDTDAASNSNFDIVEKTFDENIKGYDVVKLKMSFEKSLDYLPELELDVIYIDGNHEDENVLNDIKSALKKIKLGGILCGHDYHYYGGGVPKAIEKIFKKPDKTFIDTSWMVKITKNHIQNKKEFYIFLGFGIGDYIMAYSIIKHFAQKYEKVYVYTHKWYYDNVVRLYKNISNVKIILPHFITEYKYIMPEAFYIGVHHVNEMREQNPNIHLDEAYYNQVGIPLEKKWNDFYFERNLEEEKNVYYNILNLKDDEEYIFIQDDKYRGMLVNEEYINQNLKRICSIDY